jgi:hypothetical protein
MFAQTFTFGELWTSGDEWCCEVGEGCKNKSSTIGLTAGEVQQVTEAVPGALIEWADGPGLSGPDAATYILQHRLGKVVCSDHR